MARIRSIKPSFFRSEDVSVLPLRARLTWIGLWTHCDDSGRTKDNVRLIKGDVWPLDDVTLRDIEDDLATLAAHGRIVRYEVDGRRYLEIANWRDHQSIQKPTPSKLPPPPPTNGSGKPPVGLPEPADIATARKGREGKGREGTRANARDSPRPRQPPAPQMPRTPRRPRPTSLRPMRRCPPNTNSVGTKPGRPGRPGAIRGSPRPGRDTPPRHRRLRVVRRPGLRRRHRVRPRPDRARPRPPRRRGGPGRPRRPGRPTGRRVTTRPDLRLEGGHAA